MPVLLIAANRPIHPELGHPPGELLLAKAYARRIGPKATLWYLSDVGALLHWPPTSASGRLAR